MPHVIDPKQKNKVPKKGSLHQRCTPYFVTSDDYTLFAESVQKLQPVQNDGGHRLFEQFKKKLGTATLINLIRGRKMKPR